MKKFFLFAAAAFFAACSSDDLAVKEQPQVQLEEGAVGFEAYMQRATTRGGAAGSLTTNTDGTVKLTEKGFGVFGYYTDNNEYDQRSTPNFFYNQQVKWQSTSPEGWVYEPVKYWPNEYGANANSDDADKVTYFAYAPWIDVVPTSGKLAKLSGESDAQFKERELWGITSMTRNANQGDPILKYIASFDKNKSVDLCWGVADNNDGKWSIVKDGSAQAIPNGEPWIDVQRPASVDQKVKFTFKHATAQMRVKIDADVDESNRTHSKDVDSKTRVWVRSVTFKGFAMKGSLNLNNDEPNKAKWLDYNGQNELVAEDVIVYDGRKDGKEGVNGAVATNEKVLGLNATLVQDGLYRDANGKTVNETGNAVYDNSVAIEVLDGESATKERAGVTKDPVNLFENGDLFHVIPTDDNFAVEIVYDIETVSENLAQNLSDGATKGSSIENRISKSITFGDAAKLEIGHSYVLKLHLGLNSVKFDAAVTEWIEEPIQDVDLPLNVPMFTAGDAGTDEATIPFDAAKYIFAINGLNGGESIDATLGASDYNNQSGGRGSAALAGWGVDNAKKNANTNGIAIEELTTAKNNTTSNRTQIVTWTGNQSGKKITMTFTQLAHPLNIKVGSNNKMTASPSTKTIQLERDTEINCGNFGWMCKGLADDCVAVAPTTESGNDHGIPSGSANYIKVWRNGVQLTWANDTTAPNTFTFKDNDNGKITLKDDLRSGDIYRITLKTGDAPEETISVEVE
jgi:hypothetical protein